MAIEGASVAQGRPPRWLQRSADIRFVGYDHQADDTLIALQLPKIGEAAEDLYVQHELWDTRPNPDDTALDVLRAVVNEVAAENRESSLFDRKLLNRFASMRKVFGNEIQGIQFIYTDGPTAVNEEVVTSATRMAEVTPPSRQVRIAGVLDMIRHSTRSFSVRLESDEEIHGVMESTEANECLAEFFGKAVLVSGRAIYRPSGRLLRIDTVGIEDGTGASALFSKIPPPKTTRPSVINRLKPSETGKHGVPAFYGIWPGDETDAELELMIRDLRRATATAR